jgi:ERAP1-like C-terminal domain
MIESHTDKLNRPSVVNWMCTLGNEDCRQRTNSMLRTWTFRISPNIQSSIFCGGMRMGGNAEWLFLFDKYLSKEVEDLQKSRLLTGLGCVLDRSLLMRYAGF